MVGFQENHFVFLSLKEKSDSKLYFMNNKFYRIGILAFLMMLFPTVLCAMSPTLQKQTRSQAATAGTENTFMRNFLNSRLQGKLIGMGESEYRSHFPLANPLLAPTGEGTIIYGSLLGGYGWTDKTPYGIYSFPAASASPVSEVIVNNSLNANAGGVLIDDRYYFVNFFDTGMGGLFAYFYIYDAETWTKISSNRVLLSSIATDLTYDPSSKKIYGCFINETQDGYVFGIMSQADGTVTPIRDLPGPLFAIAANAQGEVFGIDNTGTLQKINKSDGQYTEVGKTGITPSYTQSATFDPSTGKLYWAAHTQTIRALYEVDTTTGAATKIGDFPGGEEFGGLFVKEQGAVDNAPGEVENLSVAYDPATTGNMTISFKMPSTTYKGEPLSGELDYVISLNDVEKVLDSAPVGEDVSVPISNTETGLFRIAVYAKNDAGNGPASRIRQWIGKDNPVAVGNLTATLNGKQIDLSWTAPDKGAHDGYLDKDAIKYRIIRYPEGKTIENAYTQTTYTDTPESSTLSAYWYEVIALAGNLESEAATTEKLLVGDAFTIPYNESFVREADFNLFTVVDANGDGITWRYNNGSAMCPYNTAQAANDWLITPPIHLDANYLHRVKFNAHASGSAWPERIHVAFGTDRTAAAMTNEVLEPTIVNSSQSTPFERIITVPVTGDYYFGFQSCSDAFQYNLFLDDITIEQASSVNAPEAISDLVLTPGAKGAQSVTISFTVPSKTVKGDALGKTNVIIRRGNSIIKQYKDQQPNTPISYEDNGCDLGLNTYTVYASTDENGLETTKSVFVGEDVPDVPKNIVLKEVDGQAVLTWDAPVQGANGGYVDASSLKYHILLYDNSTVVAMNVEERTYSFTPTVSGTQSALACIVYAVNGKGIGLGESSNIVIFGTPYELPFQESFKAADLKYDTWGLIENDDTSGTWEIVSYGTMPAAAPQDNDGGLLTFLPQYANDEAYIYSGKIGLSNAINPVLEFYYYFLDNAQSKLIVEASTNGYEFNELKTIDYAAESGFSEWRKVSIPLKNLTQSGYVRIAFKGISPDGLTCIHIDNITVRDLLDYNLAATNISCAKAMSIGTEYPVKVTVENIGSKSALTGTYTVSLFRNGNKVDSQPGSYLAPDESAEFTFMQTPDIDFGREVSYYATVDYADDENTANNSTTTATVEIRLPDMPAPGELAAEVIEGNAVLTWKEPNLDGTISVTDTFDDYASFIISDIGDWTLADVDQQYTAYFNVEWPHRGEPQAWIVFNAKEIGADFDDYGESEWVAFSGDQCLISFIADVNTTDDWLISPRLSGKAQTISFYVKGLYGYTDSYEVLVSSATSAANRASFQKVEGKGGEAPSEWTLVEFDVPEGTNFFAIRHTATIDGFAVMVDDVTYQTATNVPLELTGYNVYRNSSKLNTDLVKECTYSDPITDQNRRIYNVTAVYTIGESFFSNNATILAGSADRMEGDGTEVYTMPNAIIVENAIGKQIEVFSADGKQLCNREGSSKAIIPADNGIYLVKVGNIAYKVLVK